jgi:hypothetical protein
MTIEIFINESIKWSTFNKDVAFPYYHIAFNKYFLIVDK